MPEPLLLDLYCGAGGAAVGYQRAGFRVVGVDIRPMSRFPFPFCQADALEVLERLRTGYSVQFTLDGEVTHHTLSDFAAIHGSPPCQRYTRAMSMFGPQKAAELRASYPDLLAPTRDALDKIGLPYVIENVPAAPMRADIKLCGCQFPGELWRLKRERWFELSWGPIEWAKPKCHHPELSITIIGQSSPSYNRKQLGFTPTLADWQRCMGIDWMRRKEMSESIPPAYTKYIGTYLMGYLAERDPGRDRQRKHLGLAA